MTRCLRCQVSGRVQGVFFRASTRKQARELGLCGHARNLDDGSVEVLACGPEKDLATLREWLWVGPPAARVETVDCEWVEAAPPEGFTTG